MSSDEPTSLFDAATRIDVYNSQITTLEAQIIENSALEAAFRPIIDSIKTKRESLTARMGEFLKLDPNQSNASFHHNSYTRTLHQTETWISTTLGRHMDGVGKLNGGSHTEFIEFISRLDNYKAHISGQDDREKPFIRSIYTFFDTNIERQVGADFLSMENWGDAKKLLEDHYSARSHFYMTLIELLELDYDLDRPIVHFSSLVTSKMAEAKAAMVSAFKSKYSRDPTIDDFACVLETLLLYQQIRTKEPLLFNCLTPNLGNVFTIQELSRLAQATRTNQVDSSTLVHFQRRYRNRK